MNNKVVFMGPFKFPAGDAVANRVMGLAKAARHGGCEVLVLGTGELREEHRGADGRYVVDGIEYSSIYGDKEIPRWQKACYLLFSAIFFPRKLAELRALDAGTFVISDGYALLNSTLLFWMKWLYKSRFIAESTEWHMPEQFPHGSFDHRYHRFFFGFHVAYPLTKSVIAISSCLTRYFTGRGCRVVCIPPILDVSDFSQAYSERNTEHDKLRLIYAGVPGKKDYMGVIFDGLSLLSVGERERIEFNIFGPSPEELRRILAEYEVALEDFRGIVHVHGRVSRPELIKALAKADFSVLLRPQLRYANAGFPSKVPESLAAGTAVMLNYTSDLAQYIRDGYEGIVVRDCTPDAMAEALRRALTLRAGDLNRMSELARECAVRHFDYHSWAEPLNRFIREGC